MITHFHRRNQTAPETIAEYLAALRQAALHCNFDAFLDEALRDRLVGGLRTEAIQKRLLSETDLTLASSHAYTAIGANLKLIKGDFVKVYSNNDIACAEFVRDIRLGRIMFDSIDTTNSILHSVCCDWYDCIPNFTYL